MFTVYVVMGDNDDLYDRPQALKVFHNHSYALSYQKWIVENKSNIYTTCYILASEMDDV